MLVQLRHLSSQPPSFIYFFFVLVGGEIPILCFKISENLLLPRLTDYITSEFHFAQ